MKNPAIILIIFCLAICKCYSQTSSWFNVPFPGNGVSSIYFLNNNTGFAATTNGYIAKTTNGGINWSQSAILDEFVWFITFTDDSTGYATPGHLKNVGLIYKTTNSGLNWFQVDTGVNMIHSICFMNQNTGIYLSYPGVLKRTTNAGNTWSQINTIYSPNSFYFTNSTTGYGTYGGNLLKSTNGGINWTINIGVNGVLNSIFFVNELTGFSVGSNGQILKTTNSGNNWDITNFQSSAFYSLFFLNTNTGFVCGDNGSIIHTTNGGSNWAQDFSLNGERFLSIQFTSSDTGYAAGGIIMKTTNGGITGFQNNGGNLQENFSLYQNFPNPFNPATNIKFSILKFSNVKLSIYDASGKEVKILFNKKTGAGTYNADWDGTDYPNGVYFYRLQTDNFSETKKMILLK